MKVTKVEQLAILHTMLEELEEIGEKDFPIALVKELVNKFGKIAAREEILEELLLEQTGWNIMKLKLEETKKIGDKFKNVDKSVSKVMSILETMKELKTMDLEKVLETLEWTDEFKH